MSYRTRDKVLLAGVLPSVGAAPALTGADAVRVSDLKHTTPFEVSETNYHQASTNTTAAEADGGYSNLTFGRRLTGSGVAGTPPREDRLLRGCGMLATAVTGTAGTTATYSAVASPATPTLTWESAPPTVVVPGAVLQVSAGAAAGDRRVIVAWDADAHEATLAAPLSVAPDGDTRYDILAQTVYAPAASGIERVQLASYARHKADPSKSRRRRATKAAGTFQATLAPGKATTVSYTFRGELPGKPDDAAWPDPVAYGTEASVAPKLFHADVYLGGVSCARFSQLTIDLAAELDQIPDASTEYGYAEAEAMSHKTGGKLTAETVSLDRRDPLALFLAGTPSHFMAAYGAPGNGFAIWGELTVSATPEEEDLRGRVMDGISYRFARPDTWFTIAAF